MRNGQWIESDQGVGIYIIERKTTSATMEVNGQEVPVPTTDIEHWIHLVNDDGTTLAHLPADRCKNVRIARASSIPVARVAHLSAEQMAALGYVG
jgi:hypothetical protein